MRICKNCIHWRVKHYGRWSSPEAPVGECNCEAFEYTGMDGETPIDGLGYWDSNSYDGYFETGQDFGCIHWKPTQK